MQSGKIDFAGIMPLCGRLSARRDCRSGFTLVELLVVIGIIAMLISILLPSLAKAREAAQAVQCSSNMRSIGQMIFLYSNSNKGELPLNGDANWPPCNWPQRLSPGRNLDDTRDVRSKQTFQCPSRRYDYNERNYSLLTVGSWVLPAGQKEIRANMAWGKRIIVTKNGVDYNCSAGVVKLSSFKNSPSIALIVENTVPEVDVISNGYSSGVDHNFFIFGLGPWMHGKNRNSNMLFADGHVAAIDSPIKFAPRAGFPDWGTAWQFYVSPTRYQDVFKVFKELDVAATLN